MAYYCVFVRKDMLALGTWKEKRKGLGVYPLQIPSALPLGMKN
jgi:hypothetical protein